MRGPDGALTDEHIPTLDEVLEILARDPRIEPWVELKSDTDGKPYPGLVARAAEALDRHDLTQRAALHSFDISVVGEIRDRAPALRRLISVNADWAAQQGGIAALLTTVADLVDIVGIHHALYEAEFETISALRPADACSVWTLNDPDLIRRWITRNPAFVVSDDPVLVRHLLAENGPS
ncbi:glycerophosphodiester phosphodiesterase family protein [Plastorhodobacter daqingensis]|uniref:Glycerophosphodiester phosphodiesterase family protein n=1 Tax=Plastorhodobacter daqingensis TaxID=1387281 RepID=A0ABW2UIG5_9RHOB